MFQSFFKVEVDLSSALRRKLSQNILIICSFLSVRGTDNIQNYFLVFEKEK